MSNTPDSTPEIIQREWGDPIPFIPDGVQRFYKFPGAPLFSVIDESAGIDALSALFGERKDEDDE